MVALLSKKEVFVKNHVQKSPQEMKICGDFFLNICDTDENQFLVC